ncbi:MAG TPA: hypothetical protein VMZ52_06720 [Bryobacteraceae bacterium]|nr:hypothetical protein [Bryobacteraceae bacterium]
MKLLLRARMKRIWSTSCGTGRDHYVTGAELDARTDTGDFPPYRDPRRALRGVPAMW